jgi:sulfatase modifying factor 1
MQPLSPSAARAVLARRAEPRAVARSRALRRAALLATLCCTVGIAGEPPDGADGGPTASAAQSVGVPSSSASATPSPSADAGKPEVGVEPRCPPDMVRVTRSFCVDRYEDILIDARSGERASPYYSPSSKTARYTAEVWESKRFTVGDAKAQAMPLPPLPAWQRERDMEPKAVSRKGVTPNGYVNGLQAAAACRNAGKRLCSIDEWRTACRGEQGRQFPYGDTYQQGKCNVFREAHPGAILHDDVTTGHTDPRLNQVTFKGQPLLRKTGDTPECRSRWEDDAIYDMVGNLDEWVEDPKGMFAGGFYSRSAREGCERSTKAHPNTYADYSTGVRCCADLPSAGSAPSAPGSEDELEP